MTGDKKKKTRVKVKGSPAFFFLYLDVGKIDVVMFKEGDELVEILFGGEIMTTVWPDCSKNAIISNQSPRR